MKKILLLGSQHGNEVLGDYLYDNITLNRPGLKPHIDFLIGNPEARRRNSRLVESDLNRSYNGEDATYEEKRAQDILLYIKRQKFDLVLDLHTTTCKQSPCIITANVQHPFISKSSLVNIVYMSHKIARTSLIGVCEKAISIEVNEKEINVRLLDGLCDDIERFISEKPSQATQTIYRVSNLLQKSELSPLEVSKLHNFQKSIHGFYPILVGENSYKKHTDYLGFKAYKIGVVGYNKE